MNCRKCCSILPEGTLVCPVCGTRHRRKKTTRLKLFLAARDITAILSFVMIFLNAFMNITASHYSTLYEEGILVAKWSAYYAFPALEVLDVIFYAVYAIALGILSVSVNLSHRARYAGAVMTAVSNACVIGMSVIYPLVASLIIGMPSPLAIPTAIVILVYTAIVTVTTVYIFKSNYLIY